MSYLTDKKRTMKVISFCDRSSRARQLLARLPPVLRHGQVGAADGSGLMLDGFRPPLHIGQRASIRAQPAAILAEVVAVASGDARALAYGRTEGVSVGQSAQAQESSGLAVSDLWLGRVVTPLGQPLDSQGPLPTSPSRSPLRAEAPPAGLRQRLGPPVSLGVRALDVFTTLREGQRLGLFAGSGVGKSTLLAMLARSGHFDVTVLGLIGERGRELREFVEDDLSPKGMERSVVICATSDASPLMRREAAYASFAVAEHFRDQGRRVLLLLDSVTRFALACREIGLAAGEPPATRGFPPSVFAELPRLLERAGPGAAGAGSITALMTVLVDGDDHDEPIADAVRGILDGHVVLDRRIAEQGRYPPVDVLRSLSRSVPGCLSAEQANMVQRARRLLSLHADVADLVRLGAYRAGTDPAVDEAVRLAPRITQRLHQPRGEASTLEGAFADLAEAMRDAQA
jgi:flagellum-specific ATP synthase